MTTTESIREQQRATWNKFSGGWKKHDELVSSWLRPVGEKLIADVNLKDGYLVLDAATGTGEPGLSIAKKFVKAHVMGSDVAEDMLAIAESKSRSLGLRNYEIRACSESSLPFDSGYFDAAICRFGVMYFPDPAIAVKELYRVVKDGRKVAVSAWADASKNSWATAASSVVNRVLGIPSPSADVPGLFRFAEKGALEGLLANGGLRSVSVAEVSGELTFGSPEQYWQFIIDVIAPVATALAKASPQQRDDIQKEVLDTVRSRSLAGQVRFNWSALVASGTK